jgi:hypothetical protein
MPDVYMHSRFVEDLIAARSSDIDPNIAMLGAQFSDPMYYAVFHKEAKRYRDIADRMHDTDTRGLLIRMTEYLQQHDTPDNRSFFFGFLAHYALDVKVHPYVYHHVGIYDKNDPTTHDWRGLHLKFERSIDAVLFQDEQHRPARTLRLIPRYFPLKTVPSEVLAFMKDAIDHQFGCTDGDVIYATSVRHMYRILQWMTADRFGIKKQVYKVLDWFRRDQDLFVADMSFFGHIEAYDFLNETHRTWRHPITGETSTSSVRELYQEALGFASELLDAVDGFRQGTPIDLSKVFTNLSLNSGVSCTVDSPFRHFGIYRPKNNL